METFSTLLNICAGNSPVPGEFPAQKPVTRSFDIFFDLRLNKQLSKQSWGWCFETQSGSLWRQCNVIENKRVYVFLEEGFQLPVISVYQFMVENIIVFVSSNTFNP